MNAPRISFVPGREPSPVFLNRIQDPAIFNGEPRVDPWNQNELRASWQVNQRDGIKDFELDPRLPLGRTAYSGLVKGANVEDGTNLRIEATTGRPRAYITPLTPVGFAFIEIYGGTIATDRFEILEWADTEILIEDNQTTYIYIDSTGAIEASQTLPPVTQIYSPLCRITLTDLTITEFIDLRPNLNMDYQSTNYFVLTNTPLVNANYDANPWERVIVDPEFTNVQITLPDTATDADLVGVLDSTGFSEVNNILIYPPVGQTLNRSNVSPYVLNDNFGHVTFVYVENEGGWFVHSTNNTGGDGNGLPTTPIGYKLVTGNYTLNPTDYRVWIDIDNSGGSKTITLPGNLDFGFEVFVQATGGTSVILTGETKNFITDILNEDEVAHLVWVDNTDPLNGGGSGIWKALQGLTPGSGGGNTIINIGASLEVNEEILTGNKTLLETDPNFQVLDPDGAVRDVILPSGAATNTNFKIVNDSDGLVANNNTLLIKESPLGAPLVTMNETTGLYNLTVVKTPTKWVFVN